MYSSAVGLNVWNMSVRTVWSMVLFKSAVFLLVLCLGDPSIVESGVVKPPIIIVFHLFLFSHLLIFALQIYYIFILSTIILSEC